MAGSLRQWWDQDRSLYELFTSELVLEEARVGDVSAARKRLALLETIPLLTMTKDAETLADLLLTRGALPPQAEADALHIAVASVHAVDYPLTWNCRHINNANNKPITRSICTVAGYTCPEICTPLELLPEEYRNV